MQDQESTDPVNYVFVRIHHDPRIDLIELIKESIEQGIGHWVYDAECNKVDRRNHARENSRGIRNATFYPWEKFPNLTVVEFGKKACSVTMQYDPTGTMCYLTAEEPVESDKYTDMFTGDFVSRVLNHFAKYIDRIEILPQQIEPDWDRYA